MDSSRKSHAIVAVVLLGLLCLTVVDCRPCHQQLQDALDFPALNCRKHSAVLTDFGGVGDGKTSNTKVFNDAIAKLSEKAKDGGAQLIVPPGKWLTGSFNLTSHFTLFIHRDAVILASQDESEWPVLPPLPSYGEGSAGRYGSLIYGANLTDVVITGNNGTINGQGEPWWKKFKDGKMEYTRPCLIEIVFSDQIQLSNLTLINSPSWNVHPTYSRNIIIQDITILAPFDSENTDGINPDSCTNTLIQDSFIVSSDDCVAVKSGIDQYGIRFNMPTQHLLIRRLTCISPRSAGIALGSEMSGGIKDYVFWITGDYGSHPNPGWDPKALPEIKGINYRDMVAENVTYSARLDGIENDPFTAICISNVTISLTEKPKEVQWNCTDVAGVTSRVTPPACSALPASEKEIDCPFPEDKLPIEEVKLKTCSLAN
ncbi:hypothetical protein SLEP1_g39930 [Rubroshorea leprosula]|uniref:Polygalacturonase n=1 Tax=Rubroshorea leprosula TaxID=152421 RepID=A0AAV5L277_9ROSI|nr:hypothetical protein SLEP1_g39930 [Rubroshorea leprosula]